MKTFTAINAILAAVTFSILPLHAAGPLGNPKTNSSIGNTSNFSSRTNSGIGNAFNNNPNASTNSNPRRGRSALDQRFVTAAAQSGLYEIQLGEALAQSDNPDVADYGQQLIADHTAINDELADIAAANGFNLPTTLTRAQQKRLDNLSRTSDAQMDRALVRAAVTSHQEAIPLYQLQSRIGANPDLKDFARTTVPTLRQHLSEAKQLSRALRPNNL